MKGCLDGTVVHDMGVHFDLERMEKVLNNHMQWWRGELDRPLMKITVNDAYPVEKKTPAPLLAQENCADLRWTPEQVIDALDEELSQQEYLGDAFPMVNFAAFGPGVLAAFCGATLDNSSGRVWFFPKEAKEIADIHVAYDPQNPWVKRIKAIYRAGMEHWNGRVIMGIPDLGGVMDVAATLRGSENLLLDLYDDPDEVKRLIKEIEIAWHAAYADLSSVLNGQMGNTNWSGLLSAKPSYIVQCDFCYMISNPMFREFVLDTLKTDFTHLEHVIYHLDGVGELNHLDDILALDKLAAVQWVAGAGKPEGTYWIDVYRRIQQAGKRLWLCESPRNFLALLDELHGSPYYNCTLRSADREWANMLLQAR